VCRLASCARDCRPARLPKSAGLINGNDLAMASARDANTPLRRRLRVKGWMVHMPGKGEPIHWGREPSGFSRGTSLEATEAENRADARRFHDPLGGQQWPGSEPPSGLQRDQGALSAAPSGRLERPQLVG
jgi:hypothetical protein